METQHRPLCERENILSSDVADSLEKLVGVPPGELPRAFNLADIIGKLIEIAHTDDEGIVTEPTVMNRRALVDKFNNRLTNTAVFQAGYKRYEKRSSLPVIPVTDFFFKNVYAGGSTADCLDAMSPHEIKQSLPKRVGRVRDGDGTGDFDYIRNQNGEVLKFGELAGVIVFPPGFACNLLRAWLERRANVAVGQFSGAVSALEHARPGIAAVERLKESKVGPAFRQALPKPKA